MAANRTAQIDDQVLTTIADYVVNTPINSDEAYATARAALADAIGCGILALDCKECTKLLGPIVPNTIVPQGTRIPGTSYILDPILAAFNIGTMIRWLDYNDTWLAAEWGHPSDNLGGILALSDYLSQKQSISMKTVLTAQIKAYEIQGNLALLNSFNKIGFDHVILVKVATTAVATHLLGGTRNQIVDALSNAWIDTGPLRTYRHAPNTGSRKSWAAGDATKRGVELAWLTMKGEMGYPSALTAPKWGFYDVLRQGNPFEFQRPLGTYVMENILFKISFPAEFHAQTAVEAAIQLHPLIKNRFNEITSIDIDTHNSAIRIIDKKGPLSNPADRDHCLQYMVAIALLKGNLTADDYEQNVADNPQIDALRNKIRVKEHLPFSEDYHHPDKRSIANSLTIHFKDGSTLGPVTIEYPLGHRRRRKEGLPLLFQKFENNLKSRFSPNKVKILLDLFQNPKKFDAMPVHDFFGLLIP